jgi:poly-gamma-glutamate capsule biosynthesis protein CapA/YwtB (metallophosphatase superfamily)
VTLPVRLIAAGDAIINRRVSALADDDFRELRELISSADAAIVNFEATTPRPPLVPAPAHGLSISSPPFVIDELRWLGFSMFNLANNHATAYGWQAFADTIEAFESRSLAFAGGGRTLAEARAPGYVDASGGRIALVGATITNAAAALAADPGRGTAGRPGANPLRARFEYVLDEDRYGRLVEIDEAIGTGHARRLREGFGPLTREGSASQSPGIRFMGARFEPGPAVAVHGHLDDRDIAALERSVREARRQADLVVVSIHCHEGTRGEWNSDVPPDFLVEAAHRCIDAGADLIAGHGPHRMRGLELYAGKPILYSLGNLFLQIETVEPVPREAFERQGLPWDAVPADFHDHGWQGADGQPIGFAADPVWFESVLAELHFDERAALTELRLHPIELGYDLPRPRRGVPRLVDARRGTAILERLADQSRGLGATVTITTGSARATGRLELGA